jgi:hypothetical protein
LIENKQYEDEIVIPSVFVGYDDGLTLPRYDFGRITRYVFCFCLSNNEFTTFNNIQLYRGGKFYWWRKPENPEKTIDL